MQVTTRENGAGDQDPHKGKGLQEGYEKNGPVAEFPEVFDGGQEGVQ
jgi:hypothetical protein